MVKQTIDEFCRKCFELDIDEFRSKGKKSFHFVPPTVAEFMGKPVGFASFKKEVLNVPYPKNSTDLAAYTKRIKDIGKRLIKRHNALCIERHIAVSELKKYIRILEKIHPDSFFAEEVMSKENEQHQKLRATLKKVIRFL